MLWHITSPADWEKAQNSGEYRADSLLSEGFIHCSTTEQLAATANRFYAGRTDLIALVIDDYKVTAPIRYEDLNAGDLFPHIYGPLNLDAVVMAIAYVPDHNGYFVTPVIDL
jgi:uncharacterized protein (DUF952 family)